MRRPPITEQQSDDTIELRRLADEIENAEWEPEEVTRPGMGSIPEIHLHMQHQQHGQSDEKKHESLPAPAKIGLALLRGVDSWPKVFGLALILAAALAAAHLFGVKVFGL
jgi:hypothetical protein